jgi:hypothetical protein
MMRRFSVIAALLFVTLGSWGCRSAAVVAPVTLDGPSAGPANVVHTPPNRDLSVAYAARVDSLIRHFAGLVPAGDLMRGGYMEIAARMHLGQDPEWVAARLNALMQDPRGDMFWMYPMTFVAFAGRNVLPDSLRAQIRDLWRTYTPYRGDTENHWVMYYASLYLMTQMYPGEPASSWYNGRSSEENHREAREWLEHWTGLTTTIGQGEFDSPGYFSFFIAPLGLLYAYAEDPLMKQRASMLLDYLIADFAVESLNGLYTGGFSRVHPDNVHARWTGNSTAHAWLLFGNTPFFARGETLILAMSGYRPPEILHRIATDRTAPYLHRELKRTRHRIRLSDVKNAPVYKTTWMRPEYAVASMQGGLLQPIQQHTWEVLWATNDHVAGHNMLYALHPYSSAFELAMYFPEEPEIMVDGVSKSKATYDQPEKWTGGSPYEQIFQDEDVIIALYDISEGTRFPHISGFFSRFLREKTEDASGWIFARGGDALIAYHPLAPFEWRDEAGGDRRLHSPHLRNGAVVQVAPASAFESLATFRRAVLDRHLHIDMSGRPHVVFESLAGRRLEARFGDLPTVDGTPVDYAAWPLFGGPFLQAAPGSGRLELRHGSLRRILDFNTMTVVDRVESGSPAEIRTADCSGGTPCM